MSRGAAVSLQLSPDYFPVMASLLPSAYDVASPKMVKLNGISSHHSTISLIITFNTAIEPDTFRTTKKVPLEALKKGEEIHTSTIITKGLSQWFYLATL